MVSSASLMKYDWKMFDVKLKRYIRSPSGETACTQSCGERFEGRLLRNTRNASCYQEKDGDNRYGWLHHGGVFVAGFRKRWLLTPNTSHS